MIYLQNRINNSMFKKLQKYQRYKTKGSVYLIYIERGKLAMQDILSSDKAVSFINYPKTLRTYHLYFLGIFRPSKQHFPYLNQD